MGIELVHRLRGYGKIVVGLGVSGVSAEHLINACDQFLFSDVLANLCCRKRKMGLSNWLRS